MVAYANTWEGLPPRWEAGDFGRMQPSQANPVMLVLVLIGHLQSVAGKKEIELQVRLHSPFSGLKLSHKIIPQGLCSD
jgi:hypothetical protein